MYLKTMTVCVCVCVDIYINPVITINIIALTQNISGCLLRRYTHQSSSI